MERLNPQAFVTNDVDMKEYINQLVNELRNDMEIYERIKRLGLTNKEVRDNIARLTDYKNDFHYCKNCPGIDKCEKSIPHLQMVLIKDGAYLTSSYEPCDKIVEKIKYDGKYLYRDFPEEWIHRPIEVIDKQVSMRFATNKWIFIFGNHKVGKTSTAMFLARQFVEDSDTQVAFLNSPQRIKELVDLSYKDKDAFAQKMFQLANVPLLVLDDFGEEYKNEYIRDVIIIPLLSERGHRDLLTIFTSEFTIAEIQKMYSIGAASGEIRGKQLGRLIKELCGKEINISHVVY